MDKEDGSEDESLMDGDRCAYVGLNKEIRYANKENREEICSDSNCVEPRR